MPRLRAEEVHVAVEFVVNGRGRLAAIFGRGRAEPVFGAIAEAFDDPRQVEFLDNRFQRQR